MNTKEIKKVIAIVGPTGTGKTKYAIELAKTDPVEAKRLRSFMLFGKVDFDSTQKVDHLLIEVGIPPKFLVT